MSSSILVALAPISFRGWRTVVRGGWTLDAVGMIEQHAVRALLLYPMNALVNDQLGRLRAIFGDPRLVEMFAGWAGRPPTFARYTSRTPYACRTVPCPRRKRSRARATPSARSSGRRCIT